jgi:dihydroneopterin aldolase
MGIIKISGIKLYAYHGCHQEESIIGGNYVVDVNIETDFEEAAQNDDLTKTVDYDEVYGIVKREMKIPSKLIEHVARRIADSLIKEVRKIDSAEITVTKINAPVNGEVEKVSAVYMIRRK